MAAQPPATPASPLLPPPPAPEVAARARRAHLPGPGADPFAAQLLVLLCGLGTILVFRAAMDEYARHAVSSDAATVAALIERHAAHVASRVAHDWELSSRILAASGFGGPDCERIWARLAKQARSAEPSGKA